VAEVCADLAHDLLEDAQLLTSELVANAVLHGEGEVGLQVRQEAGFVHIEVTDTGEDTPEVTPSAEAELGGRGLFLVDALSSEWGITRSAARSGGKSVWFNLGQAGVSGA